MRQAYDPYICVINSHDDIFYDDYHNSCNSTIPNTPTTSIKNEIHYHISSNEKPHNHPFSLSSLLQFHQHDDCKDQSTNWIIFSNDSQPTGNLLKLSSVTIPITPKIRKTKTSTTAVKFQCQHCGKSFNTPQGLGGHNSRQHKGLSEKFNMKSRIYEQRVLRRERNQQLKLQVERLQSELAKGDNLAQF